MNQLVEMLNNPIEAYFKHLFQVRLSLILPNSIINFAISMSPPQQHTALNPL